MSSSNVSDVRVTKLTKFYNDVVYDRRSLMTSRDGKLFLEAICVQADPATFAHKLISSPSGLVALQASMRFDTSLPFLNDGAAHLLRYLEAPELRTISSGSVLQQILDAIVDPPFFWDAFTKAFSDGLLISDASRSFAWLLLQLISLPGTPKAYLAIAASPNIMNLLLASPDGETRILGQKIKHSLPLGPSELHDDQVIKPGGRHDNDHQDYRAISIMPTADELLSKDQPFLRTSDYVGDGDLLSSGTVQHIHIDNQFRLLREDMLGEIREEMKVLTGVESGYHKGVIVDGLQMFGIETGTDRKHLPWAIKFQCTKDLPQLKNVDPKHRLDFLKNNRHVLRQGNIACLFVDEKPVAFPTIHRDENELSKSPPLINLQFLDDATQDYALSKMKTSKSIRLAQLDSAVFAFEPFLDRLQKMTNVPLSKELFYTTEGDDMLGPSFQPFDAIMRIEAQAGKDIKNLLKVRKSIVLDDSQMDSLSSCLRQRVSLVQGPPGTGKSFIGALVAKILHDSTTQVILVVCFTNHALDQFLEDLMDIGIPGQSMVRLGSKSTDRTKPLMIREQARVFLTSLQRDQLDKLQRQMNAQDSRLADTFKRFQTANINKAQILDFLEFLDSDLPYFDTFSVPTRNDGMQQVGKKNKIVDAFYLLDRWIRGAKDAGLFQDLQSTDPDAVAIWDMPRERRDAAMSRWRNEILGDLVTEIRNVGREFNSDQAKFQKIMAEKDATILKSKRIIACTTNGAATYSSAIQAASPGIVLVEEAGEILEAHVLTSLGPQTQQLIMIGDHQQLRPKCSYKLGVEYGEGFDLNRSLFERLILKGFPHVTLTQQHRMRPEISAMIRQLTYPDLTDAPTTLNRPNLRGFQDNVIFMNHSHPEVELSHAVEIRDGRTSSKQNVFEGQMILKAVRYLAQQGYGSDKIVVLTPYLGQLKLLRDQLTKENDPILNDLDTFDLVRAGLLTDLSSKTSKPSLRLSTIDNYQGEESEIVLVSMTRCNKGHDIGFMSAPERLNVLLSRARNALIMIGNAETFMKARKGSEVWRKLFDHLKEEDHIYDGLPVQCERHPLRTARLSTPEDFEIHCPDGGCQEPCGAMLECGVHACTSSCHQLSDHSKILCQVILTRSCDNSHIIKWRCHASPPKTCSVCEREKRQALQKAQKDLEAQRRRDEKKQKHLNEVAKLEAEIEAITLGRRDERIVEEQQNVLAQKRSDLAAAKKLTNHPQVIPVGVESDHIYGDNSRNKTKASLDSAKITHKKTTPPPPTTKPNEEKPRTKKTPQTQQETSFKSLKKHIQNAVEHNASPSKTEWQRQKDQENAHNPAIEAIMDMIGLEDVKDKVLKIKAKVETAIRQGTDLKKERLGLVLLGNPGTGKTTVARHYATVLTSLGVLAGSGFVETTGSRLAHGGINEVKTHLKELTAAGGGVFFLNESYQLAEAHNHGGKTVLDFLLAEIENLTGKIVFVFAGYTKQMEKFFEHNPGLASRIPHRLNFEDYKDHELLLMLQYKIAEFYKPRDITVEDGPNGLYINIGIRRLGRGRGREGFGNARALENMFAQIRERQAERLARERRQGLAPDDFHFTKEDFIGPDPSEAILTCDAWTELQQLTGLDSVKTSVKTLIELISTNYQRELRSLNLIDTTLNRVFLGSPGTGKTTVAKLYGQILSHIGVLSNGEVVVKNPADFIGSVIGQSEANTKAILATTLGKILVIDEAYMLHSNSGASTGADVYKTAVIDTIVAEVQNVPGDDRCVLLLGYEDKMETMFQHVNPGLARRFQLKEAFRFADFDDAQLEEILRFKLKKQDLGATQPAVKTAIDVLSRARNGLNFGNGGDVENLISKAKTSFQNRQSMLPVEDRSIDFVFEPQDFDPKFDRAAGAETNLDELFKDVIGCEAIIRKLRGYLQFAKGMRANGQDPRGQIPMNFIFKGPSGTGKTTTARKFGQFFFDLGFLSEVEVVECSATDLIGQYVGHTGPKTLAVMERALGKVLLVDESYRLAEGHFANEALTELIDQMTKPKFLNKICIVLAGYDSDMDRLLQVNQGLSSRFADEILFRSLTPAECFKVLQTKLAKSNISTAPLQASDKLTVDIEDSLQKMSLLPGWGNARDIETLAKRMVQIVYQNNTIGGDLIISHQDIFTCINEMYMERQAKTKIAVQIPSLPCQPVAPQPMSQNPPSFKTGTSTAAEKAKTAQESDIDDSPDNSSDVENDEDQDSSRDNGVSNEIWAQLQKDIKATSQAALSHQSLENHFQKLQQGKEIADNLEREKIAQQQASDELLKEKRKREEDRLEAIQANIKQAQDEALRLSAEVAERIHQEMMARQQKEWEDEMRLREQERLRLARERDHRENERRKVEAQLELARENQRKDVVAQQKLRNMGVCVAGFRWIKQAGGYRCAGGSHFVSDSQLGI